MWIILDAYATTSMPIENMHCVIGVYVFYSTSMHIVHIG